MLILIATTNEHKVSEICDILAPLLPDSVVLAPIDRETASVAPEETGMTFKDNALLKARFYAGRSGRPCLSDDSGICVDALNGGPGVHSSRYAHTDGLRIARLLKEMDYAGACLETERGARFVCQATLAMPDGRTFSAEGVCNGIINHEPVGAGGFGYDPVFVVEGFGKTMGELSGDEKNAVSHRGRALRSLAKLLDEHNVCS